MQPGLRILRNVSKELPCIDGLVAHAGMDARNSIPHLGIQKEPMTTCAGPHRDAVAPVTPVRAIAHTIQQCLSLSKL